MNVRSDPPHPSGVATAPLVLLPGTLCDERMFAPLLARLAPRPALVLPIDGDDPRALAESLLARAPPRFALIGFSLGGLVALEMALQAPARVAGLALIDSNARARAPDAPTSAASPAAAVAAAWPACVGASRRHDAPLRSLLAAMAEHVGPVTYVAQERLVRARSDKRDHLPTLTMPALVLAGAEDRLCPPAFQHEIAGALPDATLALIEGAGHFAPLEAPDAVAAVVAVWLARVDAACVSAIPSSSRRPAQEIP